MLRQNPVEFLMRLDRAIDRVSKQNPVLMNDVLSIEISKNMENFKICGQYIHGNDIYDFILDILDIPLDATEDGFCRDMATDILLAYSDNEIDFDEFMKQIEEHKILIAKEFLSSELKYKYKVSQDKDIAEVLDIDYTTVKQN